MHKYGAAKLSERRSTLLYGVFGAADWGDRKKFNDELLKDLIEGLSSISLDNAAVDTDILGDAYAYLVGQLPR